MTELINQTMAMIVEGAKMLADPAISGTISGASAVFFQWLKDKFGSDIAKEKLEMIEKGEYNEETINELKDLLVDVLKDNKGLQEKLAKEVKKVKKEMDKERVQTIDASSTKVVIKDNIYVDRISNGGSVYINK